MKKSAEVEYDPFNGFGGPPVVVGPQVGQSAPATKQKTQPQSLTGHALGEKLCPVNWNANDILPSRWISFAADGTLQPCTERMTTSMPTCRRKKLTDTHRCDTVEDGTETVVDPDRVEATAWRREHGVTVFGKGCPHPMTSFESAERTIPIEFIKKLRAEGFSTPTPVQAQSWPILLSNHDMVGIAKTGSGKTLAFVLPAVLHISVQEPLRPKDGPIALFMAPTRELAQQIEVEAAKVLPEQMRCVSICGGTDKSEQVQLLSQGVHIAVATPGRLIDLLERRRLNLRRVTFLVLDEADRMLDMGFEPQVSAVCSQIRPDCQTTMFSATWPPEIQHLASRFLSNFLRIHVGSTKLLANADVSQSFFLFNNSGEKEEKLLQLVSGVLKEKRALVFTKTKVGTEALEKTLRLQGIRVAGLHGDKEQREREYIIGRFRQDTHGVLVATDVAARGLDIKGLDAVINFDFPMSLDDYVHRVGRTGRAGSKGVAVTFIVKKADRHITPQLVAELVKLLKRAKQDAVPAWLDEWSRQPPKLSFAERSGGLGMADAKTAAAVFAYKSGNKPSSQSAGRTAASAAAPITSLFGVTMAPPLPPSPPQATTAPARKKPRIEF